MILAADGFDHYGTGTTSRTNMLNGIYADIASTVFSCETTQPRTGARAFGSTTISDGDFWRRILPGSAHTSIGFGVAVYVSDLPDNNNLLVLGQFRDAANGEVITMTLQTTGDISIKAGDEGGTTIVTTTSAPITVLTYNHIEAFFEINGASGSVEVRVNGVTVINQTANFGSTGVRSFAAGAGGVVPPNVSAIWWDDWYCYDNSGSFNNAIGVGDIKLQALYPNADTTVSDWTRNTGSNDFEAIDENTPNGDTDYVASAAVNDESEYDLEDTDADAESIRFLAPYMYAKKDDAGDGTVKQGIGSSDIGSPAAPAEAFGDDHALTTSYSYYADIIETDPATGSLWTPDSVDDARLILNRVA